MQSNPYLVKGSKANYLDTLRNDKEVDDQARAQGAAMKKEKDSARKADRGRQNRDNILRNSNPDLDLDQSM